MKYRDLHNHTVWSDGENTVKQILDRAFQEGFCQVGISDHYEGISDIEKYLQEITSYKGKYKDLDVLVGVEIKVGTLLALNGKQVQWMGLRLDYLLIENLEYMHYVDEVLNKLEPIINKLKCKVGWAHLDLERLGELREQVLDFTANNQMFLDFNIASAFYENVLQGFEYIDDVVAKEIEVIVGSDTHSFKEEWLGCIRTAHGFMNDLKSRDAINKFSQG